MTKHILLISFFLTFKLGFGQIPVGSWRDHFSYNEAICLAVSDQKVFAAATNGVFWYSNEDGAVGKINKVNGLSDIDISTISFSSSQNLLMVGYENGNIDMVFSSRIVNLPFIKEKPMQGSKRINHILFDGNDAYVSTGFGIVVINTERQEIKDTYLIGDGGANTWVSQLAEYSGLLYAATEKGLLKAEKSNPLIFHYQSWMLDDGLPNNTIDANASVSFDGKLIVNQSTGSSLQDLVWQFDGFEWSLLTDFHPQVKSVTSTSQGMVICSRNGIGFYRNLSGANTHYHNYNPLDGFQPNFAMVNSQGNLCVADEKYGLLILQQDQWQNACPSGPASNRSFHISHFGDDVVVASGARTDGWGNRWYPYSVHTFSQQQWSTQKYPDYFDAVRVLPNNLNSNEYFVASWGNGVGLFRDGNLVEMYGTENSSLQSIIPGPFCRISGMTQDKAGNLWVANGAVANPISVRKADGTWKSFPYQNQISSDRLSDMVISPWGHLWTIIPGGGGLFVLDPGSNIDSHTDDRYSKIKLTEYDGSLLPNEIYSIAFDRDDYLWVGTNEGVLISYNPERVLEPNTFYAQRIKIPDVIDEFAVFLLKNELITTIAVDGGNRKWFGTSRSGVYLQSADGTKQIHHFTAENSPLPSNTIQHIAIHPKTGELFIATDKGLVSYRTYSTEPSAVFGKVYAFPNPVRPDYDGIITITGLVDKTIVKITDVAGNLVYETRSQGGQATWDGKNAKGSRVSTGVYLFFCTDSKGEQSFVGKLLFVK